MGFRLIAFALLTSVAWAVANPDEAEIKRLYGRISAAAEIKYVDGFFGLQAPNFQAFSRDLKPVDLSQQKQRYEQLLAPALVCTHATRVEAFRKVPYGLLCQVRQTLRWEQVDSGVNKLIVRQVETTAEDFWVKRPVGWRIQATKILSQELTTEEGGRNTTVRPPVVRDSRAKHP